MKTFLKIFICTFIIDIAINLFSQINSSIEISIINKIITFLNFIASSPAIHIDRSYPFYTNGSFLKVISIFILNVLIQSLIIYLIIKKNNSKINSK